MKYIDLKNVNLNDKNFDNEDLKFAGNVIKSGGLVLFPTETVYGLGANGLDASAVKKIYLAKGRSSDNPLILHISDMDMLIKIATNISSVEYKLIDAFWPGPFTIILNRTSIVPDTVTAGLDTVGIRMPSNIIANRLIAYSGVPIAAPSANVSGKPSGTNISDIFSELSNKVDCIIDGGSSEVGLESTVVRVINEVPTILRPGKVTPEDIKNVVGTVKIDEHIFSKIASNEKVLSPGMKYRHYAPNSKCVLVYSENNSLLVDKILKLSHECNNPLILSTTENIATYHKENLLTINIGRKNNLEEIAKNIFATLRQVDKFNPDIVLIEGVKQEGLGLAIMNRLIRACEYNYIEV